MERLEKYKEVIHNLLQEYTELYIRATDPTIETVAISDDQHGEYLLMRVGWEIDKRIYRTIFHVRLNHSKIWIEEDWTKEGISTELMRAGVHNTDIVLAFNPPNVRHLTEFAVA